MGEVVDSDTHEGLHSIALENESGIHEAFPPNSFGHIFWDEQSKALKSKSMSEMRQHPLMIKWCLSLTTFQAVHTTLQNM